MYNAVSYTHLDVYKRQPKKFPNNNVSHYAQHLINENHKYTGFKENLEPLHIGKKGQLLDALEEFEIYKALRRNKNQVLNEQLSFKSNKLYDLSLIHI